MNNPNLAQTRLSSLTQKAVLQTVLQNFLAQVGCVRVYQISYAWQAQELAQKPNIKMVKSLAELQEAFDAADDKIILVPSFAAITPVQAKEQMRLVAKERIVLWQAYAAPECAPLKEK